MDVRLTLAVDRLRKAYARNPDVQLVCDELTARLAMKAAGVDRPVEVAVPVRSGARPLFDRVAYQREFMRKWRAKKP